MNTKPSLKACRTFISIGATALSPMTMELAGQIFWASVLVFRYCLPKNTLWCQGTPLPLRQQLHVRRKARVKGEAVVEGRCSKASLQPHRRTQASLSLSPSPLPSPPPSLPPIQPSVPWLCFSGPSPPAFSMCSPRCRGNSRCDVILIVISQ